MRRFRRQVRPACRITRQTRLWLTDPPSTSKCFGHATIAVACKGFSQLLNSLAKPLIILLVRRWMAMLVLPLAVDAQQAAQLADGQGRHLRAFAAQLGRVTVRMGASRQT